MRSRALAEGANVEVRVSSPLTSVSTQVEGDADLGAGGNEEEVAISPAGDNLLNVVIAHLPFIILIIFFYGHFINVSAIFLIFFRIFPLHIDCTITQPLFHCHIWEIAYVISISSPQSPRQSPH